jgi:hypothetical protein
MLSAKKTHLSLTPTRGMHRKLQHLYARRSAIDALIQSLQAYERYTAKPADTRRRKLA